MSKKYAESGDRGDAGACMCRHLHGGNKGGRRGGCKVDDLGGVDAHAHHGHWSSNLGGAHALMAPL